jgi:hypothetical protein
MNVLLWILQVGVALFCGAGSAWRLINYSQEAQRVASLGALPQGAWNLIGAFEIVCALGLIVPAFLGKGSLVAWAAALLTLEMLLLTALHAKFFGLRFSAENPAIWSLGLAIAAAVIAWGRFTVKPL